MAPTESAVTMRDETLVNGVDTIGHKERERATIETVNESQERRWECQAKLLENENTRLRKQFENLKNHSDKQTQEFEEKV